MSLKIQGLQPLNQILAQNDAVGFHNFISKSLASGLGVNDIKERHCYFRKGILILHLDREKGYKQ